MATFARGSDGELDDRVRLTLGDKDVLVAESYDVTRSYLVQPSDFRLRLGSGDTLPDLIKLAAPKTRFELRIGDVLQQTGEVDGYEAENSVGASELTVHGRDAMARVFDTYMRADQTFNDATYESLVYNVLTKELKLGDIVLDSDNEANRRVTTGTPVRSKKVPNTRGRAIKPDGGGSSVVRSVHAKLGERAYDFLRRHLDRAGIFLSSTADGNFVLSAPNGAQPPIARIVRKRGGSSVERSHVISARLRVDTTHRFSRVDVYLRGRGKKAGRPQSKGIYVDAEMEHSGFDRPLVIRDVNCTTDEQAEYLARRKIAEGCRNGFRLEYVMSGHSTPSLVGGGRAVWAIDTVVQVDDDELGLHENFWVEAVSFHRPPTTTTLRLMRLKDLVFGTDDE